MKFYILRDEIKEELKNTRCDYLKKKKVQRSN